MQYNLECQYTYIVETNQILFSPIKWLIIIFICLLFFITKLQHFSAIQDVQESISGLALYSAGPNIPAPGIHIDEIVANSTMYNVTNAVKPNNSGKFFIS